MKKLVVLSILVIAMFVAPIFSQTSVKIEAGSVLQSQEAFGEILKIKPEVNLFVAYNDTATNVGFWAFSLMSGSWAEVYAGIQYAPASWLSFGIGAGVEDHWDPYRIGAWIWTGYKDFSLFQAYEYGGSGHWYSIKARFHPKNWGGFGVGIRAQRFKGTGPEILYKIPNVPVSIIGDCLYDYEFQKYNVVITAAVKF